MADDLKQQNNNGFQGAESNDSISSFPDSLLHHILSYLPTRGVIRTGVLSKRWKSLWTGVPRLDFDDRWLLYCDSEFLNIIERVLLLRDGTSIEQFRLWFSSYAPPSTYSRVQSLIESAVSHKVQQLDIDIYFATCVEDKFTLPCSIFDIQTLSILKLSMKCILQLPSHVSLPRLKVLHLRDFEFPNAKSIENLFSCCPVLEELTLVKCRWINQNGIKISIPTLKSLTTDYSLEGCYIKFETPALQSFKYNGIWSNGLYLTKTISPSSSIKACIDTTEHFFDVDIGRLFKLLQCMEETMVSLTISNVTAKLLSLSVEHKDLGHLPVFHRLTYLGFSVKVQGRVFKRFRKCFHFMPNLGTIEFLKGLHENIRKSGLKGMSKSLPNCFTSSLKILSLKNVFGHSHEIFFLTSFLGKAVSLQRIDIFQHEYIHKDDQVELRNEVEKLSRRFKHCAIILQ